MTEVEIKLVRDTRATEQRGDFVSRDKHAD